MRRIVLMLFLIGCERVEARVSEVGGCLQYRCAIRLDNGMRGESDGSVPMVGDKVICYGGNELLRCHVLRRSEPQ